MTSRRPKMSSRTPREVQNELQEARRPQEALKAQNEPQEA